MSVAIYSYHPGWHRHFTFFTHVAFSVEEVGWFILIANLTAYRTMLETISGYICECDWGGKTSFSEGDTSPWAGVPDCTERRKVPNCQLSMLPASWFCMEHDQVPHFRPSCLPCLHDGRKCLHPSNPWAEIGSSPLSCSFVGRLVGSNEENTEYQWDGSQSWRDSRPLWKGLA